MVQSVKRACCTNMKIPSTYEKARRSGTCLQSQRWGQKQEALRGSVASWPSQICKFWVQ